MHWPNTLCTSYEVLYSFYDKNKHFLVKISSIWPFLYNSVEFLKFITQYIVRLLGFILLKLIQNLTEINN